MTPRRGRRIGRTLLNARRADARRRAIAKLDTREPEPVTVGFDGSADTDSSAVIAIRHDGRLIRLVPVSPFELLGHHLQRAAAENA